ncbi:MAG: 50S ribosomal protein L31e [Candidatus Micrarchaeota archaeon]
MGDPTAKQDKFIELQEKKAEEKKLEAQQPASKAPEASKPEAKKEAKKEAINEEKKEEKKEKKREIVLERLYTVDLSRAYAKPAMKRANRASRLLREFLCRHLKSPAESIRIAPALNEAVRAHGGARPLKKVKLKATKDKDGIVLAEPVA